MPAPVLPEVHSHANLQQQISQVPAAAAAAGAGLSLHIQPPAGVAAHFSQVQHAQSLWQVGAAAADLTETQHPDGVATSLACSEVQLCAQLLQQQLVDAAAACQDPLGQRLPETSTDSVS